mgnify:CR=1 FL=1
MHTHDRVAFESFLTQNAAFAERIDWARRLASSDVRILIEGETGTGKSRLARAIHDASDREGRPFVEVELAGLSAEEAHERLFTSEGIWQADRGTIVIGGLLEQPAWLASKVLRINEPFCRERHNVRILLTRIDRDPSVVAPSLPVELYHRMPEVTIAMPALRDRPEDLLALFHGFVAQACGATGKRVEGWTEEVERMLLAHPWPGNLHEMRALAFAAVLAARGPRLSSGEVAAGMRAPCPGEQDGPPTLRDVSHRYARKVLARENGNVSAAARTLGLSRCTLIEWLKEDVS